MERVVPCSRRPGRKGWRLGPALVVGLLLAAVSPARASLIESLDALRFIEAVSDVSGPDESAFESQDGFGEGLLPFVSAVDADSIAAGSGRADASADQDSSLAPMVLEAFGTADVSAIADGGRVGGPVATAAAQSFFDVFFAIDRDGRFSLSGAIDAFANPEGDAIASIVLVAPDLGLTLFEREVDADGLEVFDEIVSLQSDVVYQLTALATADALATGLDSFSSAISGYEVRLAMLPAPPVWLLLLPFACLAVRAHR